MKKLFLVDLCIAAIVVVLLIVDFKKENPEPEKEIVKTELPGEIE